ncbi:hypothetical protein N9C87_04410 [Flavobacteriaceae bacterium]|jgi:hypothetical protein|nr:hypothetical protein [Flavobacteriaceae bacterium]
MMKKLSFLTLTLFLCTVQAQDYLEAKFLKKTKTEWNDFVGVDRFDKYYFIQDNTLYNKRDEKIQSYSNLQLGEINEVQVFNALKVVILHKRQNTVVLLDNRLAELLELNFNTINPYRLVNGVALSSDTSIWVYNELTLQLELFDYETNKTRLRTLPLDEQKVRMNSDYNNVYVLTDSLFYEFNYTGSLVRKINHPGFDSFRVFNEILLFKRDNTIFYRVNNSDKFQILKIPKNLIKQFFVMNQTLYIYDGEFLHHYQLIKY